MSAPETSFPPFAPRPPWWGGDLQTLRNALRWRPPDLSPWPAERLELPMRDGSGDRLAASLHRPIHETATRGAVGKPLVLLIHGLTGCQDSAYVRSSARHWLGRSHPVLRLNLRGAGPSRPLCRLQYHAGRSDDLRDALVALPDGMKARGMIAVGYSLGANMLLKYLGEEGGAAPFLAACAVSAPIDLAAATKRIQARRNRPYHRYILSRLKAETLAAPGSADGAPGLDARERRAIAAARSLRRFDDTIVAPRNGFAGVDDYYERCKALRFLGGIAVPTLLIHALDDPWIPPAAYLEYDWRRSPNLTPLLPISGGHVGFHARGNTAGWHDRAMAAFVDSLEAGLGGDGASC